MHKWQKMFLFCCGKCMRQSRPHAYKHKKYKHINQISKYADHCEWPATSRHTRFIYASFAHIWANALNSSNVYVYAPHTHEQSCTKQRDTRQLAHTKTEKMCRKKNQAHEKKNERKEHKSLVFFLLFCFVWLGSCVCAYDTRLYDMLMVWLPTWVFTSVKWLSKIIHTFFSSYFSLPFARIFILYMCVIIIYNSVTFSLFLHAFFSLSEMCFYVHVSVFHISFLFSLAFSSLSLSSSLCVFFGFCFQLSHFSHFRSLFLLISLLFSLVLLWPFCWNFKTSYVFHFNALCCCCCWSHFDQLLFKINKNEINLSLANIRLSFSSSSVFCSSFFSLSPYKWFFSALVNGLC